MGNAAPLSQRFLERIESGAYWSDPTGVEGSYDKVAFGPPEEAQMLQRLLMSHRLRPKLRSLMPATVLEVLGTGAA